MINQLTYRISFPSTGKSFSQNLTFKPGLTIISGANEAGKSLILEMIRYALFGAAALRGQLSDYDILEVELSFDVRKQTYKVDRKGNKAFLNGREAVGTAAVNKKILSILGFDLDVFDVACAAVQGDLDKLTKRMRPGERRKMVEEVIGLNSIEEEEKACRSDGNGHKKLADILETKLVEPTPPVEPIDYEPSHDLEVKYHEQLRLEAERAQLLRLREPVKPVEPNKPSFDEDVDDHEKKRLQIETERAGLEKSLRRIPSVTRTRQDIERAELFYEQKSMGPKPQYELSNLQQWEAAWDTLRAVGEHVQCPNCGTQFDPSTATVHELPPEPPISYSDVRAETLAHERWRGYNKLVVESTDITPQELKDQLNALAQESYRNEISDALAALPDLPNRSEEAERKRIYLNELSVYHRLMESYDEASAEYTAARSRLDRIAPSDPTLQGRLKNSQTYEEQKRRYDADKATYDENIRTIEQERETAEGYFKGAEALKEVRTKVKQHLVPSLNKVASNLLSQMTDGKRTKIVVDEDFEVEVDGQPVRTLSGSGASAVNLALRIALGQVLTQSVVPLFLADEIDHDMDAERAEATHKSLRQLTKVLDKVFVVTHKNIQGDNIITL